MCVDVYTCVGVCMCGVGASEVVVGCLPQFFFTF